MITFVLHGYEGVDPAGEFGPLQAEFERQGFACWIIRSPKRPTKTPNQDRAKAMVEALRDVESEVVLVGISNQGLMLPLVAAARPVRRIVLINAVIPHPGQSFLDGSKHQRVWANWIVRMIAQRAPGMNEVSPLTALPKVEYVYICGENDDSIRPEWEQWAAREYLHVEPVVVKRASHASIVLPPHASQVVAAATQGLQANEAPTAEREAQHSATPESTTPDIAPPQRGRQWNWLTSLPISGLAPLIVYFFIRPHVTSDTEALALAWLIPVVWTLGSSLWLRRLNVLGLLGVVTYGIALAVSIAFGAGALPLKLHRALVGGAVGLVCLGSVAMGRPIFLVLLRLRFQHTEQGPLVEAAYLGNPRVVKRITNLTLLVGVAALADAVLQTVLAIALSTSAFLIATTAIHVGTIVAIALGLLIALRVRADTIL